MRARPGYAGVAATLIAAALVLPASPAFGDDYPSWDEVAAAKANVASREAEAARIGALVASLETTAAALGDAAVEAAGVSAAAAAALATAEQRASTLATQSTAADAAALASGERLGRVGAVLARSGGADVTLRLLFDGDGSVDLLQGLSRAAQVTKLYGGIADAAEAAKAESASLSAQADVAERERSRLADAAAAAAAEAESAHEAAEAELAGQRVVVDTLYAQLASLRDSTAALERQYEAGEQLRQAAEARQLAAAAAAEAGGDVGSAPPPGVVVDTAGAKAYAAGAVARYGWGSGEYQCLVQLWTRESSWRADAYNASSGAYGIPQSLPGSKMASAGADWRTNAATQIEWGLSYISGRYGSPCGAWAHSERFNWY
ncbi:aggregation-promoting factor C-terminal-like domain-containing protein [Agromyces sp. NPDC055520]